MNATTTHSLNQTSDRTDSAPEIFTEQDTIALRELLKEELTHQVGSLPSCAVSVISRIVAEVERICRKSDRIQNCGDIRSWQLTLARHRLSKCIEYYKLGSKQGRKSLMKPPSENFYN